MNVEALVQEYLAKGGRITHLHASLAPVCVPNVKARSHDPGGAHASHEPLCTPDGPLVDPYRPLCTPMTPPSPACPPCVPA